MTPDDPVLRRLLNDLCEALPSAKAAIDEVRCRIEACWPRNASLRAMNAENHALYKSAMRLAAGGPYDWGDLFLAIDAGNSTLDAFGQAPPAETELQRWLRGRVDPDARADPDHSSSAALREALATAQAVVEDIRRRLEEIERLQPAERSVPTWSVDDARRYIAEVKWQKSRPPQPTHWYTVRTWSRELTPDFLAFVVFIRREGVVKAWPPPPAKAVYCHAYLAIDSWDYWTMGAPVRETTVINRAPLEERDHAAGTQVIQSSA